MIIPEKVVRSAVEGLEAIQINSNVLKKPSFGWGNKFELNRYLELKKDSAYPLIWMIPTKENHEKNGMIVKMDCTFILATRETRKELFNDERLLNSFKVVLFPLLEDFKKSLKGVFDSDFVIEKIPNYSENKKENGTIDLWDAITIDVKATFKEDCLFKN